MFIYERRRPAARPPPQDIAGPRSRRASAEIIRPVLRWDVAWVVEHHGRFQMRSYARHSGWAESWDENARDHPCFASCATSCERWDQAAFDPGDRSEPLAHFEPMLRRVFARKAHDPADGSARVKTGVYKTVTIVLL